MRSLKELFARNAMQNIKEKMTPMIVYVRQVSIHYELYFELEYNFQLSSNS